MAKNSLFLVGGKVRAAQPACLSSSRGGRVARDDSSSAAGEGPRPPQSAPVHPLNCCLIIGLIPAHVYLVIKLRVLDMSTRNVRKY